MKTKFIFIMAAVGVLVTVKGFASLGVQKLTPAQVSQEIRGGNVIILDANPKSIYRKHHVPTAQNINFVQFSDLLPKNRSKRLIFYCMNEMCTASHQAAEAAVKAGYKNVALMPSGINGWLKSELPIETDN